MRYVKGEKTMFKNWRFSKTLGILYIVSVGMNEWSPYGVLVATINFYVVGADLFMMLIIFDLLRTKVTGRSIWVGSRTK